MSSSVQGLDRPNPARGQESIGLYLLVYTDSQLLVGQLSQGWRIKAANLHPLVDEATTLSQTFGRCDLVKVLRDETCREWGRRVMHVLGH